MVFNPARPEIATVTSETLQAKIRQLLPSQDGFGADLAAQNIIVPVIDLTAAASNTDVPEYLQTALAFGSITSFNVNNTTTAIANVPGFYRVFGAANVMATTADQGAIFNLVNGATTKVIFEYTPTTTSSNNSIASTLYDFTVFLDTDDVLNAKSDNLASSVIGCIRQVADSNGTLVFPSGFTPQ